MIATTAPDRIAFSLLLALVVAVGARAQEPAPSRPMKLLEERMSQLDEYRGELETLRDRLRSGHKVRPTDLVELERRFEPGPLDAVDHELEDIYRLERLLERLRVRGFTAGRTLASASPGSATPDNENPEAALGGPRPRPHVDDTPEPVLMPRPTIATDWVKMGDSFFSLGDYRQALHAYENVESVEEGEVAPRVLYQIALCYERMDQYPSAQRVYQKVVERHPETYWGKQSIWALDYVSWKQELEALDRGRKPAGEDGK